MDRIGLRLVRPRCPHREPAREGSGHSGEVLPATGQLLLLLAVNLYREIFNHHHWYKPFPPTTAKARKEAELMVSVMQRD